MSEEIIKVLDNLGERFGVAIDWSSQNVMPYLQNLMDRFVKYNIVSGVMWIIISVVIIIGSIIAIKRIRKYMKANDYDYDDSPGCFLGVIISSVLILIFGIVFIYSIFDIVQNIYMPELSVINYIKSINI